MWLWPPIRQRAIQPSLLVLPCHFYSQMHIQAHTKIVRLVCTTQQCRGSWDITETLQCMNLGEISFQKFPSYYFFLQLAYQTITSLVYCCNREQRKGLLRETRERECSMRHFSTKPMDSASSKAMNFAPSAGQQW